MCEEPMWGVVLELEVRIGLTVNAAAGTAAEGAGDGGGTAAASSEGEAQVELQEDVYGPFSGQVGDWGWGGRGGANESLCLRHSIFRLHCSTLVHTPCTQVMTAAAMAFRRAMLEAEPRLAEAMYLAQVGV